MGALSDADYRPCPHCGRELHKWSSAQHVRACPKRPEIAQRVREAMTGADSYAVTLDEYAARVAGTDLPSVPALYRHFDTWYKAVRCYGVPMRHEPCAEEECPHCGRALTTAYLTRHVLRCPLRPEIAEALRAALTSPEDGCLASREEYEDACDENPDLPHANTLRHYVAGWEELAARFDLPVRTREAVRQRVARGIRRGWAARRDSGGRSTADDDPLLVGAKRVAWDYGDGDGLVAHEARPLHSGGVAYMLR